MTKSELKERAFNMVNSKLFFAHKRLHCIQEEMIQGSKISRSILKKNYEAQCKECLTLEYIIEKI